MREERWKNKLLSSFSNATIALTTLKSQRPRRREAPRRKSAPARGPAGNSSFRAKLTTASKARANIAIFRWVRSDSHNAEPSREYRGG